MQVRAAPNKEVPVTESQRRGIQQNFYEIDVLRKRAARAAIAAASQIVVDSFQTEFANRSVACIGDFTGAGRLSEPSCHGWLKELVA